MSAIATLIARLAELPVMETQQAAVHAAADRMQQTVQQALSTPPGGPHEAPWLRTGTLRDSISATFDNATAVVGSTSPVAVDQELGTATIPPRPFFGPAGASLAVLVADEIAASFGDLFRGLAGR